MQTQRVRWNRVIILITGAGILLALCAVIWWFAPQIRRSVLGTFWKTDPQLAAQAARNMMDYDLPPGYQELKVLNIQGQDAVMMVHRERPGDAILVQGVSKGIIGNDSWRANYERGLSHEMGDRLLNMQETSTQKTTVRGQPTTLRLFEGTDETGRKVKQVVCGFSGKNEDLLLAIVGGQETWDQARVDDFLHSIR